MHTYKLCISLLPTFCHHLPILTKSSTGIGKIFYQLTKLYTGIDEIVYQESWLFPIPVYNFVNTGKWFCQYQQTILPIPVYDFDNTSIWFCQCRYTLLPIPVNDFKMSAMEHFWTSLIERRDHRKVTLPMIKGMKSTLFVPVSSVQPPSPPPVQPLTIGKFIRGKRYNSECIESKTERCRGINRFGQKSGGGEGASQVKGLKSEREREPCVV